MGEKFSPENVGAPAETGAPLGVNQARKLPLTYSTKCDTKSQWFRFRGRFVGKIIQQNGRMIFSRKVKAKHLFRKFDGYAFDLDLLYELEKMRVKEVEILAPHGRIYSTSLERLSDDESEQVLMGGKFQRVLPLKFWAEE